MQIDDLKIFLAVAQVGRFTKASEQLMLSKQYVSRRVAALEASLNVQLFVRNTRKLSITEAGERFKTHAEQILDDIDQMKQAMSIQNQQLHGSFKISLPMSYGMSHLSPIICQFLRENAGVSCQVELADRYVDVIGEGFDLALRVGRLADSTLIARHLGKLNRVLCCSPDYIRRCGVPTSPEQLLQHSCLRFGLKTQMNWDLCVEGQLKLYSVSGPMVANNGETLAHAAVAGLGITLLPEFIVAKSLASGALVTVLDEFRPPLLDIHVVYPQHRQQSVMTQKLLEFLKQQTAALV
ncbi:LysR family transcriptional regulator [Celerinatantimonas yamalensis]|uniref:LysR family transcriptional regulator n=1 Tax=Celerinatantimonas yamalensis TaxID=559956 RepID=A0ABW9G3Z1_9GAMM